MKLRPVLLLVTLIVISYNAFAQFEISSEKTGVSGIQINATLLPGPGLSIEKGIGSGSTLELFGNLSGYAMGHNLYFSPKIGIKYNYYYSINRRESMGKPTVNNSGNYFTVGAINHFMRPVLKFESYDLSYDLKGSSQYAFIAWGVRRPIGKSLYFGAEIGASFFNHQSFRVGPYLRLSMGWTLFNR